MSFNSAYTRRQLLAGTGALIGSIGLGQVQARAGSAPVRLALRKRVIEVNGKAADVFGIHGPNGFAGLNMLVGERFHVEVVNELAEESLIHWHGLTPPVEMDGVPMLPRPPIAPGKSVIYDFQNFTAGTHWMHSHVGLQEQKLLAAPLIVRETQEPMFDEQEHVVMLHDFTFRDPNEILAELKGGGGLHASHAMDHSQMDHSQMDHSQMDHSEAAQVPAATPVEGSMLNDIAFDAYLANERTLADPEVVSVEKGSSVRLRIINGSAASNMWIDTGELQAELIAVDGHTVRAIAGSRFPLAIAQRADIRIRVPASGGAWPVLFRPEGLGMRTGIVLATAGSAISKIAAEGDVAPALDLELEKQLEAVAVLREEPVTRTEMVMLTGGGADYSWGLNGKPSMHDTVFTVREGERLEVMMHNMTTMSHPMHLHGHYFKVVAIDGKRIKGAIRDTVLVPPGSSVTIMFDALNPGTWAFHCHHLYHMNSGMMGTIAYSSAA
jgi:FtsP/CotA-like multicopper oxidase with cupredoxin domain